MERWKHISIGCALLFAGICALLYAVCVIISVPIYQAHVFVSFERQADYDLVRGQNSFLYSSNVFFPVCKSLNLPAKWGKRFFGGDNELTLSGCYAILSGRFYIVASEPREIEILLSSDDSSEAVELANTLAWSCADWFNHHESPLGKVMVQVRDATDTKRLIFPSIRHDWKIWGFGITCIIFGILWVRWGRKLPPPHLVPQIPEPDPISKY